MNGFVAVAAPMAGGGIVGPIALLFIFLLLISGLVLIVRLLLARLRGLQPRPDSTRPGERATFASRSSRPQATGGTEHRGRESRADDRPLTGRVLKERYLSGKITRAEYDEQLRRLQLEEYLEGEE